MPPSLPASRSGERLVEAPEDLGAKLTRRAVDAAPVVEGRMLAQVGWQLLGLDRMSRHDAEGLHVHDEAVGRALGPARHHLRVGQPVVRRVRLDGAEVLAVVAQALLARAHAFRIPVLRERLVRPRARADADRSRHRKDSRQPESAVRAGSAPARPRRWPLAPTPCLSRRRAKRSATSCWNDFGAYERPP